jgi:hypothetical protein
VRVQGVLIEEASQLTQTEPVLTHAVSVRVSGMKLGLARDFPETKFSTVMAKVPAQWDHREQSFGNSSIDGAALRYFPSVT